MNKKYLALLFLFTIGITLLTPCYSTTAEGGFLPPDWKQEVIPGAEGAESWISKLNVNSMVKWVIRGLIGAIATVLLLITETFMKISQSILGWVTSEGFINVQFTRNYFVDIGWGMIRDLTNILIVLGLVVIALATILRITSYQMKKTLPLLIAVAILINFTPMLCGIVIDASNIVMNHFLKSGQYLSKEFLSAIGSAVSDLWGETSIGPSGMLATGLLLVGSSLFSGIIFLLYACLFLFRYVSLWILVVFSPLALFCLIFPSTKQIWNKWLSQFIQWSFIGIPAAFSLYLANEMTDLMLDNKLIGEMSSMGKIMVYIVPVAFLVAGFFMSLQTGAIGANAITTRAKKGVTAMSKTTTGIAGKKAMAIPKSVATEIGKLKLSYQTGRKLGLNRSEAIQNTAGAWWKTRVKSATPKSVAKGIGKIPISVMAGTIGAVYDTAKAATNATLGIKATKKGLKTCPACGNKKVAKSAKSCPECGYNFE